MHGVEPVAVVVEEVIELIGLYVGPWFCFGFSIAPLRRYVTTLGYTESLAREGEVGAEGDCQAEGDWRT